MTLRAMVFAGLVVGCSPAVPPPAARPIPQPTRRFAAAPLEAPDAGDYAFSSALGDFNRDGVVDLAIGEPSNIEILTAVGRAWRLLSAFPAPVGAYLELGAIDADEDGRIDLISTAETGVAMFVQTDAGVFEQRRRSAASSSQFVITDLNGDGPPKLIMVGPKISLIDAPVLTSPVSGPWPGAIEGAEDALISSAGGAEVDQLSLFVCTAHDSTVHAFRFEGGGFGTPTKLRSGTVDSLEAADFDGDGREDLILGHREAQAEVLVSIAGGGFRPEKTGVSHCGELRVADLDLDQDFELLCLRLVPGGSSNQTELVVLDRDMNGVWTIRQRIDLGDRVGVGLDVADLSGDGRADVAIRLIGRAPRLLLFLGEP